MRLGRKVGGLALGVTLAILGGAGGAQAGTEGMEVMENCPMASMHHAAVGDMRGPQGMLQGMPMQPGMGMMQPGMPIQQGMPMQLGMGPGMGMGMQMEMGPGMGMALGPLDQDGDGVVLPDEVAMRHEEIFQAKDRDDDGFLAPEEFMSPPLTRGMMMGAVGGMVGPMNPQMQQRMVEVFKSMESDGDGKLSKEEFMTVAQQHYAAADTNQDGKVTVWEFRASRHMW